MICQHFPHKIESCLAFLVPERGKKIQNREHATTTAQELGRHDRLTEASNAPNHSEVFLRTRL